MFRPHESPTIGHDPQLGDTREAGDGPIRISQRALKELESLFPGDETRHVRVIATPG
ncbi:hypothetical protein [Desulfolutivibrio sp.]|uniref:hypothetical protein n=1 Tax=Desulfolutivibrio sp. TaxID=2773296 RepID=UPI002F9654F3